MNRSERRRTARAAERRTGISCPDCSARSVGRHLVHDEGCPVGAESDRQLADDRAFFDAHPGVRERRRPPFRSEIVLMRAVGAVPPVGEISGTVLVRRTHDPDVRVKTHEEFSVMLPTEPAEVAELDAWWRKRGRS